MERGPPACSPHQLRLPGGADVLSSIHTDGIRESNYDGPLIEKSYAENVVVPREGRIANSDELRFLHPCAARFCCGESAS